MAHNVPFFARFLEQQQAGGDALGRTTKYPSDTDEDQTLKFPSDSDEIESF